MLLFLGLAGSSESKIRRRRIRFGNNHNNGVCTVVSAISSSSSAIRSSSSSEERVYEAVMKQAALAEERRRRDGTKRDLNLKMINKLYNFEQGDQHHHDFFINEDLLKVAYDRCGQICSESAKAF